MRIALVTETFPPEVNGVTRTLEQLARGLVDRGHELLVVRPRQPSDRNGSAPEVPWEESLHRGCPIPRYPGLRFGLPARRRLAVLFTERRPHVVHIATEGPLGLTALLAARSLGIPITSTYHTNFHQYGRFYGYGGVAELLMRYMRWFHNRTSVTLVPSKGVKASLEERGFSPVDLLARGVDTRLFHPEKRSEELRRSWGAGPDDPVALYVSRLAREKNPRLTRRTFEELRRHWPGCRTVVVGDGPAAAQMAREDPESRFCGMRLGEDLAAHYASGDVLLFPSLTETFGNVILEGMASGLAVLAFDYAAAGSLVTPGREGFTPPFADEEAWLSQARILADLSVEQVRAMGRRARQKAEGETWESIVGRLEAHLEAALDDRSEAEQAAAG